MRFGASIESKYGLDEPAPQHSSWRMVAVIVVAIAVILAWRAGTFDRVLYNVGLNTQECARNAFGATFCGHELSEYRKRVVEAP